MHEGSKKAILAALFANTGIAIADFVASLITRSAGLLAGAGHSVAAAPDLGRPSATADWAAPSAST